MPRRDEGFLAPDPRLRGLTKLIQAIAARQSLAELLALIRADLAGVMEVQAISVKLLDRDGRSLRYAASYGLPPSLESQVVDLARSPFNQRIVDGELFVTGRVTRRSPFQFGEGLRAAGIQSVLLVPLRVDGRVVGILGAYCTHPDRFGPDEVETYQIVASLVAIAIENARANEEVQRATEDRTRFMLRVAHNCRAPLAAMITMLDVVRGHYLGPLSDEQQEYLRRVDRRAKTLLQLVGDLMALAQCRAGPTPSAPGGVDPQLLATRLRRTFGDEATSRGLQLEIAVDDGTPALLGVLTDLEQALENLIANALRYTPQGRVGVTFGSTAAGEVSVRVEDTGIGIAPDERGQLFQEFFRAASARALRAEGTGLGLAIVQQITRQHGGRIEVDSVPGRGSTFTLVIPAVKEQR